MSAASARATWCSSPPAAAALWHVTEDVRKLAVCRHSMPRPVGFALRAWNKLVAILSGPAEADPLESNPAADTPAGHA